MGDQPASQGCSGKGFVSLVGAGPGDPELLTIKALRRLEAAEVIVHDRLIGPEILAMAAPSAERIYAGKERDRHFLRQVEINELLVRRACRGQRVVRLKGGDPLIFGRGGEEIEALWQAGIPFEIVPGVTAAAGCAASAIVPLTHRDHAQTLIIATGHAQNGEPDLDWQALCRPRQTLVFYMGHKEIDRLCQRLVQHGLPADLPAALVENGTLPGQRVLRSTLAQLPATLHEARPSGPVLIILGEVAGIVDPRARIGSAAATVAR